MSIRKVSETRDRVGRAWELESGKKAKLKAGSMGQGAWGKGYGQD